VGLVADENTELVLDEKVLVVDESTELVCGVD